MRGLVVGLTLLITLYAGEVEIAAQQHKAECLAGDNEACYEMSIAMINKKNKMGQDAVDYGVDTLRKLCREDMHKGCDALADYYFANKLYIAARPHLEQGCKRGRKVACESMGTIYRDGHVRVDDVKARGYYEQACELKSGDACLNIALMYEGGFGVTKDNAKTKSYYQRACAYGKKYACKRLEALSDEGKNKPSLWQRIRAKLGI